MKKKSNGQKNKNARNKRADKKKAKEKRSGKKGTGSNDNKAGRKGTGKRAASNVGRNKRGSGKRSEKLSQKERAILREFEALLKADESVKPAKIRKKRGDKLFIIDLRQRGFQNKIIALRNADFTIIDKFLKKQPTEPLYVVVTLKIKNPTEVGYFYNAKKSPPDMVVNTVNTKEFCIEVLRDYNDDMIDMIHEKYDEIIKVYNVIEMSIRFLFLKK